ncbi:Lipopolysaccharide biosynthesis protein RffA [Chitinispirillum alkaliphilum]|nr:Lipopolysaccharide biosynthesis protein RffA [Chitinispirillum alkaliphilum]
MHPQKRIFLSAPHMSGKEREYVLKAFDSNWIAPVGPDIDTFEKEITEYTGAKCGAAVSSGTAAIHLALMLLGVEAGDEVVCSTFTFAGSVFPVLYQRAVPVLVDSERESWNMDPNLLETAVKERVKKGKKPKALIVVHLYGQSANMDSVLEIANRYEIPVVEDAAESLGAKYRGKHTGTFARFGIFSFNGNKIITSSGGGMLVGVSEEDIGKARYLATQARIPAAHYEHREIGYNYRMSNIVAAIGRGQLGGIDKRVERKREIFDLYKSALEDIDGVDLMPEPVWSRSNRWLTCITLDPSKVKLTPEQIRIALENENIESRPLWKPMHLQPVFAKYPAYTNSVSDELFHKGLCLPSGTGMDRADLIRVIESLRKTLCS